METLRRITQYFRTPLVVCGTVQTIPPPNQVLHDIEDVPTSFYKLFGRYWRHVPAFKQIVRPESLVLESAVQAFKHRHESDEVTVEVPVEAVEQNVFGLLGLPQVDSHKLTDNIEQLLNEGKELVSFVLSIEGGELATPINAEHGFHAAGTASGEGFTCAVYRKSAGAIPVYIITGELDISADTFHALACDIEFRHKWDDQFYHASAKAVSSNNVSLVHWVVKWPWPLAPREYNYLLTPRVMDDGTKLVMATSVAGNRAGSTSHKAVPVKEYFGITAAKQISDNRCRYCLYYFDDPRLPGKMPDWLEQHVTQKLLPSFPRKILLGAALYPRERLVNYCSLNAN